MDKSTITLEYNKIIDMLCELAMSQRAKQKLSLLKPYIRESECKLRMQETTDAKRVLESFGTPPLSSMKELDKILELCSKGSMLVPEQLLYITQFLSSCKRMKTYLKRAESLDIAIAYYGGSIDSLNDLYEEIDRCVRNGYVDDSASPRLRDIRRKIENSNIQVKSKLDSLLRSKKEWFMDGYVSTRNGHFVLPVKREYKNMVVGTIIDTSTTGGTYFIEPASVNKLQDELSTLQIEEENEVRKILYTLTAFVDEQIPVLKINTDTMESLDVVFAKAKLSAQMSAIAVDVNVSRRIIIKSGRHPLLNQATCIPLDFEIGNDLNGVVITGPNTGGKTVTLKTVGLLSMMAQSGLHVPVNEGSEFCMHNLILCDIGDGQSITENLSTFSSHIINIIDILNSANHESLVLLDELGSGTDPAEGMGIAISILEELKNKNCLFVATTHYPEIKEYARNTPRLVNARMSFDKESLQPLYKLEIGEAGESCALYIAKRLGFPAHLLKVAYYNAYKQGLEPQLFSTQTNPQINLNETFLSANNSVSIILKEKTKPIPTQTRSSKFNIGDSVLVYPQKDIGIVYQTANERGEIGVQVKGNKKLISHKRIKLQVATSELYPPNYDFSIIFDTVENRKARHQMNKMHNPDLLIKYESQDKV